MNKQLEVEFISISEITWGSVQRRKIQESEYLQEHQSLTYLQMNLKKIHVGLYGGYYKTSMTEHLKDLNK